MGVYVHIHVAFNANFNDGIAALAKKHLPAIMAMQADYGQPYAIWFLNDLSKRTGENLGPKGGLSLWGMVGNYTLPEEFCECLRPFWSDLLAGDIDGGPCAHERVIVFSEREQSERAEAYEIWQDEGTSQVTIKHHLLPFSWMQM